MENVRRLFTEVYNLPFPTGLSSLIEDLDIDLDTYADYVVGTASSVIKGVPIENGELRIDYELSRRIDACIEKLKEYQNQKRKLDKLAEAINSIIQE